MEIELGEWPIPSRTGHAGSGFQNYGVDIDVCFHFCPRKLLKKKNIYCSMERRERKNDMVGT